MSKSKAQPSPSTKFDPLQAALAKINGQIGGKETEKSILSHSVYPGQRVAVVISDGRKFVLGWAELGDEPPEPTEADGPLPDTA